MYTKCPECDGSIPVYTAICEDCGFDLAEYCNEFEAWTDSLPPVEAYEDAA